MDTLWSRLKIRSIKTELSTASKHEASVYADLEDKKNGMDTN